MILLVGWQAGRPAFNFFGASDTSNFNFWGPTPTVAAPLKHFKQKCGYITKTKFEMTKSKYSMKFQ